MHKLRLQLLLLFICSMKCSLMHGMLSPENIGNKYVLWSLIVPYFPLYNVDVGYRMFAMVDKGCNKIIEDSYRSDKKRIEQWISQKKRALNIPEQISWNKNFTQCAWVTTEQKALVLGTRKLKLTRMALNEKKDIMIKSGTWTGYKAPVFDDQVCSFFDKKGDVCCYGVGNKGLDYSDSSTKNSLIEFSLNLAGKMNIKECYIECPWIYSWDGPCGVLLNFPVLLKAILRTGRVDNTDYYHKNHQPIKKIHIDSVIIPEDYKTFKQHVCSSVYQSSYLDLGFELQMALDQQYKEQQREKNSNIIQEK